MTEAEVMHRTREYLVENFLYMRRQRTIGEDDSLLHTGVIASLGVMELVGWVEQTFSIVVDPAEITEPNFDTVRGIAKFIQAKRQAPTG
jgi:acyl carrier protein